MGIPQRVLLFIVSLVVSISTFAQVPSSDYLPGELFIKIKEGSPVRIGTIREGIRIRGEGEPIEIKELAKMYRVKELEAPFKGIRGSKFDRTYHVRIQEDAEVEELLEQFRALPYVEYAERVPRVRTFYDPNDPFQNDQWYLEAVQASSAWDLSKGDNVVIAIVDDAVATGHEDISANLWVNLGETAGDGVDNDNNGYIDDINGWDAADGDNDPNPPAAATNSFFSHGTHCAGIAAGATDNGKGIASLGFNAKIMAVKCAKDTASDPRTLSHAYSGVLYAIASGADVISMSWGSTAYSQTLQNIFLDAYQEGIVCIAAAGNANTDERNYPAAYEHVIAVAATSTNGQKASYSSFGEWVDISAPGSSIYSTLPGTSNSYGYSSGTSMATPIVAGLAALMRSYNPSAGPREIYDAILVSASSIDAQNPSFSGLLGAGQIHARAALEAISAEAKPIAAFTQDRKTICKGEAIQFEDLSKNGAISWEWSFPGGTPAVSTSSAPVISYAEAGTYTVSLVSQNAFGSDTLTRTAHIQVLENPYALPFIEDFESGSLATQAWHIVNKDNGITWGIRARDQSGANNKALSIPMFGYEALGEKDHIDSPPLDLSTSNSISLSFEHAYQRYDGNRSDTLSIFVSTDGGKTFPHKVYTLGEDGTGTFATALQSSSSFYPADSSEWCSGNPEVSCHTVDLSQFSGKMKVVIRFSATNQYQNNLYIDNIEVMGQNLPPRADFTSSTTGGCGPLTVLFTDGSVSHNTLTWSFPGGNPSTSTEAFPIVVYEQPGAYDVQLIAENEFGKDTMIYESYINLGDCIATACDTLDNFLDGTRVLYTIVGQEGYMTGHNDYYDKAKAEYFENPDSLKYLSGVHIDFAKLGSSNPEKSINLVVWDDNGTGGTPGSILATKAILFSEIMEDILSTERTYVDLGEQVPINRGFFVGIELEYGLGPVIEDTVAIISTLGGEVETNTAWEQYSTGQWFPFESSWGIKLALGIYPFLSDLPLITNFTLDQTEICIGEEVQFTNLSLNASEFEWSLGDGEMISEQTNPQFQFEKAGILDIKLTAFGNCHARSSLSLSQGIFVHENPRIVVDELKNETCDQENGHLLLSVEGGNGVYNYTWDPPLGTGSFISGLSAGNYSLSLSDGNGCKDEAVFEIGHVPGPDVNLGEDIDACESVELEAGDWTLDYVWSTGASGPYLTIDSSQNVHVLAIDPQINCEARDTIQINIFPKPEVNLGEDRNMCNGSILDAGNPGAAYLWSTGHTDRILLIQDPGTYSVEVSDGMCLGGDTVTIAIIEEPTADFEVETQGLKVLCINTSEGSDSYRWNFGGLEEVEEVSPSYTFPEPGEYMITLIAENTCAVDSIQKSVVVDFPTGTPAIYAPKISIFPNPVKNHVNIEVKGKKGSIMTVKLVDNLGKTLIQDQYNLSKNSLQLQWELGKWAEGVYHLVFETKESRLQKTLIIKR